ncbi:MAG: hypothetical protein HKN40_05240, partial [Winogradskyella sp.]|uniref:hypothetical protein n=1 Tax=Winogradskyella sp. TaxID=1883156 RepID=UPI0017D57711|nr:hypothetical protein [Winogradskyella sp.]
MINFPLKSISALILLTIFNNSSLYAQERYKITYDYKTEQITYLSLDKNNIVKDTLAQPKLKRNSLVELQLKNVNPFAVKVETNVKEENLIQAGQGFNFSSLLGGINSFTGNNLNLNTANLPDTGLFSSDKGTRGIDAAQNAVEDINTTMTTIDALKTTLLS